MISPGARTKAVFLTRQARFECPAAPPGCRVSNTGSLWYVGYDGFSWSSSIPTGNGNAHYLSFYHTEIYPQYKDNRAYGFPLRCLQE